MKKQKKKKSNFLGFIIVLLIALFFLYLIYNNYNSNKIETIEFTNSYYNVYSEKLVPDNYINYILDLQQLRLDEFTDPITEYAYLYKDSLNLRNQINFENNNRCITYNLKNKIQAYNNSKKELIKQFEAIYPTPKKIYWNQYIENLKNQDSEQIELKLKEIQTCN